MDAARIVLITAPDAATAERLAREAVDLRLAACVNCLPGITSVYRWKGRVESASEVLMIVKTTAGRVAELEAWLSRVHPYELPECVSIAPDVVGARFLEWIDHEVGAREVP